MNKVKYFLSGAFALLLIPALLTAQDTYREGETVVSYFTSATAAGLTTPDPKARIAITADGNYGDADDWGATPLTLSIIDHAGYNDRLVHYDYCSKTMGNPGLEKYMEQAALEGAERFGFDKSKFFHTQRDPEGAANNLAEQINASTNRNGLVVLLAGSTEVLWQAINRARPAKRKHVYVISHGGFSKTNNNDIKRRWGHSAVDVIALGVNWLQISDQNKGKRTAETGFATGTMKAWEFIRNTKHGRWLYDWIDRVDSDEGVSSRGYRGATGDASDAGLAFFYFTGDENGNVTKLKDFYGQATDHSRTHQAIRPFEKNNSYWQYKGKPVFLLGGNIDDNPFQLDEEDLVAYLDGLKKVGGNYIRNTMSDRDPGNEKAFKKLKNGKFDLEQWNDEYWRKFRNLLKFSAERDIIVHVTLWDRFDHYDNIRSSNTDMHRLWIQSPWNPANNINYTKKDVGLEATYRGHPGSSKNPFFKTPPSMEDNPAVLHYQQAFIKRIMDIGLEYGNVLYNMGNEHQEVLKEWDRYWCGFIRDYASSKGKRIQTSAMFDRQSWQPVVEGNDVYSFVEGSKVGSQWTASGEPQYDVALELVKSTNHVEKRPVNAVKVRTQKIVFNAQERLWRPLMAGFAAVSHHRISGSGKTPDGWPVGGLGFTELAKANIKAMRIFTDMIKPWECESRQDLLRNREADEAYLLANEGKMYGLYFPQASGSVGLDLTNMTGSCKVRWIDIGKGEIAETKKIKGGKVINFEPPYDNKYGWACCVTVEDGIEQARVFPGEHWLVKDPKDAGLDPDKLDAFVASIGGDGVVIKDGYLVKSWGDPARHDDWASAAKPCISTLLFFAIHQQKLSGVDELVAPWVEKLLPGKKLRAKDQSMTFRHLADMTSGYTRGEAPGTHWAYNDYAINLYASLMTEVFGESLDNAIREVLNPLQFQDSKIFGSRKGHGVLASPRDFARIGWFWLNKGNWKGRQLLPAVYFEKYMKADVPADLPVTTKEGVDYLGIGTMGGKSNQSNIGPGVYGFNWWFNNRVPGTEERLMPYLPEDAFMANGHWGKEVMLIIPSWGMVVAGRCFEKEAWGGLGLLKTKTLAEAVTNQNILK